MEDGVIVTSIFGMRDKILNRFRRCLGEESNVNVTEGGVQDGSRACLGRLRFYRLLRVDVSRFLVLYVTRRFDNVFLVGEHVEADFARPGADEHGISLLGFFQSRVGTDCH